MRSKVAMVLGLLVALFAISLFDGRSPTRAAKAGNLAVSDAPDSILARTNGAAAPASSASRQRWPEAASARRTAAAPLERDRVAQRFPTELGLLSSVYEYWASEPLDPAMTASEQARIGEMMAKHKVEPRSVMISCTAKICRSQMTFPDIRSAGRLHQLERRENRRVYFDADPGDEFRVAIYWTLTDEATKEAPEPDYEEADPLFEDGAEEHAEPESSSEPGALDG
jgi:hypothetical protein